MPSFLYSQFFITPSYPVKMYNGQTIIVTGSNVGLGKEAARHFARLGAARLIMAVRNLEAGEAAKADIVSTTHCDESVIQVWKLDLSSNESVRSFARRANTELERIDVVVENAAVAGPGPDPESGFDRIIAVNVTRTFLLALLLLPRMQETHVKYRANPRLVIVTSEVHAWTALPQQHSPTGIFEALKKPSEKELKEYYQVSKLLEVLVVKEMARTMSERGDGTILNMLNPGLCHSELARDAPWQLHVLKFFLARTTEVGSRTLLAAAAAGEESHGKYMSDGHVDEAGLSQFVRSDEGKIAGKKVWEELKAMLEEIEPGVTSNF